MSAIDRYAKLKARIAEARAWQALSIAPAKGKFVDVVFDCAIFDRTAPNPGGIPKPDKMPNSMREYVTPEAVQKADNIISGAIARMDAELLALAEEARREYRQIAADAGIVLP